MKKFFAIISIILCISMLLTGCKNTSKQTDTGDGGIMEEESKETEENEGISEEDIKDTSEDATTQKTENDSDSSSVQNSGEFKCITDMADYWNNLYTANEAVLNAYEGMPIMALVTPGLCFITGVQYDILNIYSEEGRFEGELMLAGYPAFVEKKGPQITFGYEVTEEEDGYASQKGDKKVETGSCDLEKGNYFSDSYTERSGAKISRSTNEFQKQADGSMCTLIMDGSTLNYQNEEDLTTTYIFIRSGKDQYDFVVANSTVGTKYEFIYLEDDMTKEKAIEAFNAAGATIENSGGIKDGTFYLD